MADSRPASCVADFEARELHGRLQGPPAAWPTCDPFRRWPSVSTRGKAPVPKSRRRGRDELCLPPLHGTQGGAVERPTPGARRGKSGVCASSRQFLLQEDVSSGLSARRLDPRRRRAETGFAAGLNWDGVKRASARFSQVAFCVSPGPFFLKESGSFAS